MRRLGQQAGDVNGDISDPDDGDRLGVKRERVLRAVRMPAVPGNEIRRREATRQILTLDSQPPVGGGPARHDERVIMPTQVVQREIPA